MQTTPKISDFGLAKMLDVDTGQTPSGAVLGAPFIETLGFNGLLLCTAVLATIAGAAVLNLRRTTGE